MTLDILQRRLAGAAIALSFSLAVSGCAGFGNLGNEPGVTTVTLASVNNPQMQDMAQLLPEFNKDHPDIKINMIFMEENDLRNAATKDVATQGGQYDIMTVGAYEVPIWGQNRWLEDLTDLAAEDPTYDVDDFFKPVRDGVSYDDRLYAVPFYGESSFLMYRKDLFEQAGITMPERPTWDQIAEYAGKLKDPASDRAGICLRAKPGWGEMFAPLTTVINTFGGQWYNMDWQAQVNSPAYKDAVKFYIDTLAASGEGDPVSFGFTECLNLFSQERAAMWYDATSAAGSVEDPANSKVAGKVGYVRAPVKATENSGWLW
jgi:sorbitol/mannitol transport system substrate-binding protein